MPAASTINELKWQTLTSAINEMKSPNQFLKRFLWSNSEPVETEDIEIHVLHKDREIAPFVRKNGEAVMVPGYTSKIHVVSPTNIRIKRPFTPSELLFGRRPGTTIHLPNARTQLSALQTHIARDLQVMADMVTNAEEWLCSQALIGKVEYEVADQEVYTITFPKPAGNNITLSTFLNQIDATNPQVFTNMIHAVKRVLSDEVGLVPTDAIVGIEAADAILNAVAKGFIKVLDTQAVNAGMADFISQFNDDGVIYLGTFSGVRFWEYSRSASLGGSSVKMVRDKYIEFVSRSQASQRVMYYGAIADMAALRGRRYQGERFSKSWEVDDPSALMALLASRPLPVPRRPGATVSVKAVSG